MSTHKYLDTTGLGQVWGKIKALITQSDWEEDDNSKNSYVLNRPAIRAGDGENSVMIGQIEQVSTAAIYDITISGDANATEYTYTTETTIATPSKSFYVLFYSNKFYPLSNMTDSVLTLFSSLGNTAINGAEAKLYYKYKIASGIDSIVEGQGTIASGQRSHAEGSGSKAFGSYSHAEGMNTLSNSTSSHAEGYGTTAFGNFSHAEGSGAKADGTGSHAEGQNTQASGSASHTEGNYTIASGYHSHAEGTSTIAQGKSQHVFGEYNIPDTSNTSANAKGTYVEIVGNGTAVNVRSNARTLDWNGNGWYAGKVSAGTVENPANPTEANDLATKQYVDNHSGTSTVDVSFNNLSSIGEAIVGTTMVGDDDLETETSYQTIYDSYSNDALIYFHYYNYFGQASKNSDNSFSAICFESNDLDNTEGIKIIYKSDGTIVSSRFCIPVPEDDINVLNLLSSYGFVSPISDASGNVIVDADNNLILG